MPDPLENPLLVLTEHPLLSAEAEAELIATMLAGVEAREVFRDDERTADPALLHQITLGEEARATLVRHNMRLVVSIAKRYVRVAGQHLSLEDLVSFGSIGLLQGLDKFDPRKSGRLSTYVTWWIRQAIGRGIAEESRVIDLPVHIHERMSRHRKARSRLTQRLGREPSPEELARELGWRPQQLAQLEAISQETMSLNEKVRDTNDRTELGDMVPDPRFDPEETALETTLRHDLLEAMNRLLSEREQRFLRAYYGLDTGQPATLEASAAPRVSPASASAKYSPVPSLSFARTRRLPATRASLPPDRPGQFPLTPFALSGFVLDSSSREHTSEEEGEHGLTEAERREFEIDDLLAGSLPHEGSDHIRVSTEDAELILLRAEHSPRWRVVTGPITLSIVAVLELGHFHLAWALTEDEETPIRRKLRRGEALRITLASPTQGTLELTAPALPASLQPLLDTAYLPISAA